MTPKPDWRHLAEQASVEMDSKKLSVLVEELNRVLDEQETLRYQRHGVIDSSLLVAGVDSLPTLFPVRSPSAAQFEDLARQNGQNN